MLLEMGTYVSMSWYVAARSWAQPFLASIAPAHSALNESPEDRLQLPDHVATLLHYLSINACDMTVWLQNQ